MLGIGFKRWSLEDCVCILSQQEHKNTLGWKLVRCTSFSKNGVESWGKCMWLTTKGFVDISHPTCNNYPTLHFLCRLHSYSLSIKS